ncbi:MAG: pyrroline-5-carboxylate reductase, partial [Candidatus Latescibacteria bacterium]|nr:pyrroline-5-carboxylate reductase [Candidatus Latescibacterota bacterium]
DVTDEHIEKAENILGAVGFVSVVPETYMDAVTGLSGSGPAYVAMMIDALSDGGVKMGLPRTIALKLAAQTVLGTAKMILENGIHPAELRDMVASPGGTTIEGVSALEAGAFRALLIDAVEAATLRSRELSS